MAISLLTVGAVMAKRGMLAPAPPHRQVNQLVALRKWGFGLAGELRQAAGRSPHQVAVIDEQRGPVTYAELLAGSEKASALLQAKGFRPGQRLGLLARNHVGAIEVMTGAAAVGIDLVLMNTGLSSGQLALVAEQQEVVGLIHDDEFDAVASGLPDSLTVVRESDWVAELAATARPRPLSRPERGGRTIILTSGTTGTPKGAARRTPGGFGPLISIIERIPLNAQDRILISAPLFHTWGYAAMQLCFALRATIVLQRRFDPQQAKDALETHDCHAMFAVPVMLQRMMELPADPDGRRRRPPPAGRRHLRLCLPPRLHDDLHGRVRRRALQPLRLDRGVVGLHRHPRGPAPRPEHGRHPSARDRRPDPRPRRPRRGAGRDRADLLRQRPRLRRLHVRHQQGLRRRARVDRRHGAREGRPLLRRRPRRRHDRQRRRERLPDRGRVAARRER